MPYLYTCRLKTVIVPDFEQFAAFQKRMKATSQNSASKICWNEIRFFRSICILLSYLVFCIYAACCCRCQLKIKLAGWRSAWFYAAARRCRLTKFRFWHEVPTWMRKSASLFSMSREWSSTRNYNEKKKHISYNILRKLTASWHRICRRFINHY